MDCVSQTVHQISFEQERPFKDRLSELTSRNKNAAALTSFPELPEHTLREVRMLERNKFRSNGSDREAFGIAPLYRFSENLSSQN